MAGDAEVFFLSSKSRSSLEDRARFNPENLNSVGYKMLRERL